MIAPMLFAVKILESIDIATEKCTDKAVIFEFSKIRGTIQDSIELARPLISEDEEQNAWLFNATTKPFDGIEKGRLFSSLSTIKPDVLRWLLLITRD